MHWANPRGSEVPNRGLERKAGAVGNARPRCPALMSGTVNVVIECPCYVLLHGKGCDKVTDQ